MVMRAQTGIDAGTVLRAAGIRLLLLDFDGVLTDNRVIVDENGIESVVCHRGDGWGIARLRDAGVMVVVVSTEKNPVVEARCKKLNVACRQAVTNKRAEVRAILQEFDAPRGQAAYVGNDLNDIGAMDEVDHPIAVADAHCVVLCRAKYWTVCRGGHGAVREVAEAIVDCRPPEEGA